ncbi:hypothetical protein CAI21_05640 [Alkalilimnicola ehrlichii]|uniref:TraB/GumN family protein n=1 Tax=Alkalilimnicola ehrlichii TaxID=351052 RepID=A0A3E0X1P4_9GAMM|nr:TraB/GumN family protein [Alkalilimnicola ehrlichii]RFA30529.1 hypothetical protein CAI21_05640 [Alkalilimnicola ehrlichii]RFA38077.1 hypothetical protein CAL65_07010 [Alkalilimnicola ehrlichii]
MQTRGIRGSGLWLLFLLLLLSLPCRVLAEDGVFWRIVGPGGQDSYLLGSIHVAPAGFHPLPGEITQAFQGANALVVEVDISQVDPAEMFTLLQQWGMFPPGESLEESLDQDTWRRVVAVSEELGLPLSVMNRYRPWLASLTLSTAFFEQVGFTMDHGIDYHFLMAARDTKPVIELETVEEQLGILAELDSETEQVFLQQTLDQLEENGEEFVAELGRTWREGDLEGLQTLLNDSFPPEFADLEQRLITERNKRMTQRIEQLLEANDSLFVVVGAGHLPGESGLIALLRQAGYELKPVEL